MIEGIEAIYSRIADAIVAEMPEDWSIAKVEAIFFSDSIDFESEYSSSAGKLRSFRVGMDITKAFEELRRKFKDAGQPLWGQAHFELHSNGKFNMKWGYENCDKNGDTIFDEEKWHQRQEDRRRRLSQP